ncbi:MAG: ABC transporter ATP-binding protein [Puniceicoccales bacterium]|jgi:ABC-type lipoprotein export system ATPase subunit|nr:ABC transporter ATP-binding protein [Puniceicoccales bacterium]
MPLKPSAASSIVALKNVSKYFPSPNTQTIPVLQNISLEIAPGQTISITGESGSGKSTLLNIIGGLERSTAGSVFWKEKCISEAPIDRCATLRQNFIGFIFQASNLIPELTALENVLLPARIAKKDLRKCKYLAEVLFQRLAIVSLKNRIPANLSGGERQRVAIARALMLRPELVIADEPTGNLDENNAAIAIELLLELCREYHSALLLVTHNPRFVKKMQRPFALQSGNLYPL